MIYYLTIMAVVAYFAARAAGNMLPELCPVSVRGKTLGLFLALALGTVALQAAETSKNLISITSGKQFEQEVLKSEIPVLVDFYADWCPPCQKMLPIMSKLADEWKGKVKFVKVNVDNNTALAEKYEVGGIPDVRIFVGGEQKNKYIGYEKKEFWDKVLKSLTKE